MKSLAYALVLAALCPAVAGAVVLNPHGYGAVLVFPYYSVNGGNSTLLSIVNDTDQGKALKVRFHEGYDGRAVADFDLYLAAHESWSANVVDAQGDDSAAAGLITRDGSCTVPAFGTLAGDSTVRFLAFSGASYAGANTAGGPTGNSDGGPTTLDRTREGHFDVIEMGELSDAQHGSLTAIAPGARHCAQLTAAWDAGGYWQTDSSADLTRPGGGLYGSAAVINVARGELYATNALAIDGFSATPQHTAPGSDTPDLNTASTNGAGLVPAFVDVDGRVLELDYADPVDAVSALFMTDVVSNAFNIDAGMGAGSDWVVTAPTKRFYVDPKYVGLTQNHGNGARPPFQRGFAQNYTVATETDGSGTIKTFATAFPYACVAIAPTMLRDDGTRFDVLEQEADGLFPNPALDPCLETSVLTFATAIGGAIEAPLPSSTLGSKLVNANDPNDVIGQVYLDAGFLPFQQGTLRLDLSRDSQSPPSGVPVQQQLSAASNGDVLYGIPVIGFLALNYGNSAATPGVLTRYSGVYPHHAHVRCANPQALGGACR